MKHLIVNAKGEVHAIILGCPFKYTTPRGHSIYEDLSPDFVPNFNPTGKREVECFKHDNPKCQDDVKVCEMDFAVVRDGKIENVVRWGGAEWLPPKGTMLVPVDQWMGSGDHYDVDSGKFIMHESRKGRADIDMSVEELKARDEADMQAKLAEVANE